MTNHIIFFIVNLNKYNKTVSFNVLLFEIKLIIILIIDIFYGSLPHRI